VLVVGNPANTNAYIAMKSAPDLPAKNFTAMLRLDHNRALSQLAAKAGVAVGDIEKLVVWGNHSPTMYPDYRFATAGGASLKDRIGDEAWNRETFIPKVGKRGAAIIEARGLSSAASAANAAIDHVRDWVLGTERQVGDHGRAVRRQLRHPEGVIYGFPVTCETATTRSCSDLPIDDFSRERMDATLAELEEERAGVAHCCNRRDRGGQVPPNEGHRNNPQAPFPRRSRRGAPLQVIGAINAYHALLAKRAGYKAIYLSGGGVAAGSLGLPDLGISTLDDVLTDVRRITDVCDLPLLVDIDTGFGRRLQHRAHGQVADQGRRRRDAHRGPGRRQALRPPPRQGIVSAGGDGRPHQGRGRRAHRPGFVLMARTDALAVEGSTRRSSAPCLRRGRRRHGLPRGDDRPRRLPALRRRGEGAGPGQHHRVRQDAAVHRRRAARGRRRIAAVPAVGASAP
jgi:hypothetical protein